MILISIRGLHTPDRLKEIEMFISWMAWLRGLVCLVEFIMWKIAVLLPGGGSMWESVSADENEIILFFAKAQKELRVPFALKLEKRVLDSSPN